MSKHSMSDEARRFRFGPFELDAATGELCRNGIRLPIQGQPLQILELLLREPGEMVSREQLRQALWPEGTYVDFNDSLNAGIRRLRLALEDDADQPRFIETLPRRGYRFLGTVHVIANGSGAASTSEELIVPPDPKFFYSARLVIAIALVIAIFPAVRAGFRYILPQPALTEKDVIVVTDFDNRTGEPVFDITLKEALAIDLRQSPFLNLLPDLRVDQTLKMMRRSPGDRITPELGRDICLRTSSKALVTGSIASLGSHYALQLKAIDCQTEEILAASKAEAERREKVLDSLGGAAARLRSKLGESLASVRKFDRPLEEVTTSSLEALQAYSAGARAWDERGDAAAVPFLEHAVELDQNFAAAYNFLHFCYGNQGKAGLALKSMRRAYLLRDRLIEPEKYFISAWYYSSVTGEIPKAIEQLQGLLQEYPRHIYVHGALGDQYRSLGQLEKAAEEYREQVRLFPSDVLGYGVVDADIALNRFGEAQAVLKQGISRMPDHPWLHWKSYKLAFLENDPASMQKELDWARGKPGIEPLTLLLDASTQAYYGRLTKARQVARASRDSAKRDGAHEAAAFFQTYHALVEAEFGNQLQAREAARAGLASSSARLVRVTAGLALASAGDFDGAQQQLDALNHEYPLDTLVQNYWAPTIRAQINVSRGHAELALELLQSAVPYELSLGGWGLMHPVFVRGRAYLASNNGTAAAAEFEKILDHRGLVCNDPTGALAHLYLGRARVLEARSLQGAAADNAKARARAAYQDFLTLWKDADRDIPILREAKAEFAKLQ